MQTTSKSVFHHNVAWADFSTMATVHPTLAAIYNQFNLSQYDAEQGTAALLNQLASDFHCVSAPMFVEQQAFVDDRRYYEQIIAEDGCVPTRADSWHDFFNGLIWLQFPQSKRVLNRMHIEDIIEFGVNPRTARRNRITHFDECGLILVCHTERAFAIIEDLTEHNWISALFDNSDSWHTDIEPLVFGHANFEMLLNPYKQLTAKWLMVEAPKKPSSLVIDDVLQQELCNPSLFANRNTLKPLPLLGVPGWAEKQTHEFYVDTSVFRPLRRP